VWYSSAGVRRAVVYIAGKDPRVELGGGHSAYVRAHARAALTAGYEPHLFGVGRHTATQQTDYGVVHSLRSLWPLQQNPGVGAPSYTALSPLHVRQLTRALLRFLRGRRGPHLLHGFGVWGSAASTAAEELRRRGERVVVLHSSYSTLRHENEGKLRGLGPQYGAWTRWRARLRLIWIRRVVDAIETRAVRGADLVLVNYDSVRQLVLAMAPAAERIRCLPYTSESLLAPQARERGPDPAPILAALEPRGAPLVVAVARHDPRKGLDVLLRALAALRDAGTPLRAALVGGGVLLQAHRARVRALGLERSVAIPGFVPDPQPWLRHADLFALPSLEEGSGSLALVEALAAGVAVVTSDCDGLPEDVSDGETGLLVKPGSREDLAQALARLASDPGLRARLGRAGRARYEARFAPERFLTALAGLYAELGFPPDPGRAGPGA
jgi:glycosyltransferase involved in cell wall biosynthesis